MTIVQIDPLATTSLLCTSSTLEDNLKDLDSVVTTASGVATTIAVSGYTGNKDVREVNLNVANQFVEALSDTQLAEMAQKLEALEQDFVYRVEIGQQDGPKIYQKTPNK